MALAVYDPALARQAIYEEPKGNVGRKSRLFFLEVYGPFLMNKYVKIVVIIAFFCIFCTSVYGFTRLQQGLNLTELAPSYSYLRKFDAQTDRYFTVFDQPIDIFFPNKVEWWKKESLVQLKWLHEKLSSRPTSKMIINSLLRMLQDEQIGAKLQSGNKEIFSATLYEHLSNVKSPYKQFEYDYIWQGKELITWRFKLLPEYMRTSEQRAAWMKQIRDDCGVGEVEPDFSFICIPYNFMMIFYESDLRILSSVIVNMLIAAITMLVVAFALIPQLIAGVLVIFIIFLIDATLFGFMYFWNVKLNMVSSIALVISIGFAVDYSAHLCHTFTHCEGETRNLRVIESLVLMGSPVFHGAISTLLGVIMLGFSTSYIFGVFFKMMVMVIVIGAVHGVLLLPVLLSYIGPLDKPEELEDDEDEERGEEDGGFGGNFALQKASGSTEASDNEGGGGGGGGERNMLTHHPHNRTGHHYHLSLPHKGAGGAANSDIEGGGGGNSSIVSSSTLYLQRCKKKKHKNKMLYAQNPYPPTPSELYYYGNSPFTQVSGNQVIPPHSKNNMPYNYNNNSNVGIGGDGSECNNNTNAYSEMSVNVLNLADLSACPSSSLCSAYRGGGGGIENSLYSESELYGGGRVKSNSNSGVGGAGGGNMEAYNLKPSVYGMPRNMEDNSLLGDGVGSNTELGGRDSNLTLSDIKGGVGRNMKPPHPSSHLYHSDMRQKSNSKTRSSSKRSSSHNGNKLVPPNKNINYNSNNESVNNHPYNLQSSPTSMRYSYIHQMVQNNRHKQHSSSHNKENIPSSRYNNNNNNNNSNRNIYNDNETELSVQTPGSGMRHTLSQKISSALNIQSYASNAFKRYGGKKVEKNHIKRNNMYIDDTFPHDDEATSPLNPPPSFQLPHLLPPMSDVSIDIDNENAYNQIMANNSSCSLHYSNSNNAAYRTTAPPLPPPNIHYNVPLPPSHSRSSSSVNRVKTPQSVQSSFSSSSSVRPPSHSSGRSRSAGTGERSRSKINNVINNVYDSSVYTVNNSYSNAVNTGKHSHANVYHDQLYDGGRVSKRSVSNTSNRRSNSAGGERIRPVYK